MFSEDDENKSPTVDCGSTENVLDREPGRLYLTRHSRMQQLRRFFTPAWLWMPVIIGSFLAGSLPFVCVRTGDQWEAFRGPRAGLPLSLIEKLYQLNVDQPDWIWLIRHFPAGYGRNNYRINRPGYPALVWLACRGSQGVEGLVRLAPGAWLRPCSEAHAIFSGIAVNWLLFVFSIFGFCGLLVRWKVTRSSAALASAHLALSPFMHWALVPVSTNLTQFPITLATLWLITFILEAAGKSRHGSSGRCEERLPSSSAGDNNPGDPCPVRPGQRADPGRGLQSRRPLAKQVPDLLAALLRQPTLLTFCAGLTAGSLTLIKGQYDALVTGWLVMAWLRRLRELVPFFLAHFFPLVAWIGIVSAAGWVWRVPEFSDFRQGIWIWEEFLRWPLARQGSYFLDHLNNYGLLFYRCFGPITLFFMAIGLARLLAGRAFLALFLFFSTVLVNLLFVFAIRRPYAVYAAETFFVVLPVAVYGLRCLAGPGLARWKRSLSCLYLLLASLTAAKLYWVEGFVWVSPW
jgi:hypothetical protein